MPNPILVLADRGDWPTDRVVQTLTERGAEVFRMDTAEFPQDMALDARIGAAHSWAGSLVTAHRGADLGRVRAVYYRTPTAFRFEAGMSGPERRFAAAQARSGFGGVLTALECRWVSHPVAMSRAEYKPVQLDMARRAGLRIPETLITNRPDAVRSFAEHVGGPIVTKPVASPMLIEGDCLKTVYTRRLTPLMLEDLTGIETTAHLFQAWVPKSHEVRLTVVGERLLAAEIHAGSTTAHEDWRADYGSLRYEVTEVPAEVRTGVLALMNLLGLRFGALDFIVDPYGQYWFLEVNPCGQWDWIQHATGLPISEAIADELQGVTP
ncbi:ATP-grasp ribosomal peptide maturase [Streptosporangium sp. NBC_01755]|uniref:ATP-grasp ribosomal peptide maturase n=1 Tax=unclassified Streptosporangium TaxID=2632669 RepID=UPI002DD83030|nr:MULTISPECIES: ATP-grasp ribosomal peptide maturase [unclassified Streptosporangium]WSA23209.1 ATP-grasp ribosomal peptide maturase [Streptosporangium sp. NBC_01810]WSC98652.1 ATP-grasp ribosomal peptide maturase [Streptosporangium sp. NBC_01755]